MKLKSLAMLTALVALSGCTLPYRPTPTPTPVATSITGNWEITLTTTNQAPTPFFGIYLMQTGSTVSGYAWVQMAFPLACIENGPPCGFPFEGLDPNLTGTIDADGNIVLTSTSPGSNPEVFTITGNITEDTTLNGTYIATSGAYTAKGTISGNLIAPLNGTYTGTVVSTYTGQSMGVTTTLNQSSSLNSRNFLSVTASATFTGSPCFTTATMQGPADTYSGFLGNSFSVSLVSTSNSSIYIEEMGSVSPDAKTIQFSYGVVNLSGNGCIKNDYGSGTLTLQ